MLITILISLFSTRLVLKALGQSDFGLFSLIMGVVSMLAFMNVALSNTTQRFLSFNQGSSGEANLKSVFYHSLLLHILIAAVAWILIQIAGAFLFDSVLKVPDGKLETAKFLYQMVAISVVFTILTTPYSSALIARENLLSFSVLQVLDTSLKLLAAVYLSHIIELERLKIYGVLFALISGIVFIAYVIYGTLKYSECKVEKFYKPDYPQFIKQLSFAGWNIYGLFCVMFRNQGIAILYNSFFGTLINAAYGVAQQVSGQVSYFANSLGNAVNPQIAKAEGAGDRNKMLGLSISASKFGYLLYALIAIPLMFEMDTILELWLDLVPEYAVLFCQLILLAILLDLITFGARPAIQSIGKIRNFTITYYTIKLLPLIIGYIYYKFQDTNIYLLLILFVVSEGLGSIISLYFLKRIAGLRLSVFLKNAILPQMIPTLIVLAFIYLISFHAGEWRILWSMPSIMLVFTVSTYFFSLNESEKLKLKQWIKLKRNDTKY